VYSVVLPADEPAQVPGSVMIVWLLAWPWAYQ
jgi:hypothetical protein